MTPGLVSDLFAHVERFERRVVRVAVHPTDFPFFRSLCKEDGTLWGAELVSHQEGTLSVLLTEEPTGGGPQEISVWTEEGGGWRVRRREKPRFDRDIEV